MKEGWKKIYSEDGTLLYEGFTLFGKPYGAGTSYYSNGNKCHEGVFDIKGLVQGRQYYMNGNIRFEGSYRINRAYGPNYPVYGTCYDEDGIEYFRGELSHSIGGVGYCSVKEPKEFGPIHLKDEPDLKMFMWEHEAKRTHKYCYVDIRNKQERQQFIEFLEKQGFLCEEDEAINREEAISSILPITVDLDTKIYGHMGNITCAAAAVTSRALITVDEFYSVFRLISSVDDSL